jgi:hypothetical protein
VITWVPVVSGIAIVPIIAVVHASMRRGSVVHQAIRCNDFPQILPLHINENLLVFEVMPNILTGWRMELLSNEIRDVLPPTIEQVSHSRILLSGLGNAQRGYNAEHAQREGQIMATAQEVAAWMADEMKRSGSLSQTRAARQIKEQFGDEFVYRNENRNWAIQPDVLEAFNELTKDTVVWIKKTRRWRTRKETDKPGRQQ